MTQHLVVDARFVCFSICHKFLQPCLLSSGLLAYTYSMINTPALNLIHQSFKPRNFKGLHDFRFSFRPSSWRRPLPFRDWGNLNPSSSGGSTQPILGFALNSPRKSPIEELRPLSIWQREERGMRTCQPQAPASLATTDSFIRRRFHGIAQEVGRVSLTPLSRPHTSRQNGSEFKNTGSTCNTFYLQKSKARRIHTYPATSRNGHCP
jgi:hypothetical protein